MNSIELTPEQAYELWNIFGKAIGLEELRRSYGVHWPRQVVPGERVWEIYEDNQRVGWCALRPDPDPIVWQISGVFPEAKGHSYVREIFKWCVNKAFELWPKTEAVFYSINKGNEFLDKNLNWIKEGKSKAVVVGEINFPLPGYIIFAVVNKERAYE